MTVELGADLGVPVEESSLVETVITRFRDCGHGEDDITEVIRDFSCSGLAWICPLDPDDGLFDIAIAGGTSGLIGLSE